MTPLSGTSSEPISLSKDWFDLVGEAWMATRSRRIQEQLSESDILLLDMLLPRLPGIETLRELTTVTFPLRTLLLCSSLSKRQIVEALQLGGRVASS